MPVKSLWITSCKFQFQTLSFSVQNAMTCIWISMKKFDLLKMQLFSFSHDQFFCLFLFIYLFIYLLIYLLAFYFWTFAVCHFSRIESGSLELLNRLKNKNKTFLPIWFFEIFSNEANIKLQLEHYWSSFLQNVEAFRSNFWNTFTGGQWKCIYDRK